VGGLRREELRLKRGRTTAGCWVAALCVAATMACKPEPEPPEPPDVSGSARDLPLTIRPTSDSNGGRPLYILVRTTTPKSFIEDDYSTVARLVFAPDETVIATIVVFPGRKYEVKVKLKTPGPIGVYCLFTGARGESWKAMFADPSKIDLAVGVAAIEPTGDR